MEVGYNKASWDICSFSALGMFPNRGCFPFHFPGQHMQWHQGHTLDMGGPVAMGTTSSLLLRGSSARWPVQDLAVAKCRWGGDCCKAQTSFFWRRPPPPALLSQELLMAQPRHLARFCPPSFWRGEQGCPRSGAFQGVLSPSPRFRCPAPP